MQYLASSHKKKPLLAEIARFIYKTNCNLYGKTKKMSQNLGTKLYKNPEI